MIILPEDFDFVCDCGCEHKVSIQKIVIENDCLCRLGEHLADLGITGKTCAVYDTNTYSAKGMNRPETDFQIILNSADLHADEKGVDQLLKELPDDVNILIAVGSGTIHDITRYCAAGRDCVFVSAPTAASVDGFASSVAAMTWKGFKVTMPAVAPALILADISVISQAPSFLSVSGVGDILGKYICLADWKIARILTGEYYCEGIAGLMKDAVNEVMDCINDLKTGEISAFEKLTYGLLLSGVAMQLSGNSRPASGAEHHISHFIELGVIGNSSALHGEKVGVGTLLCARKYHELYERKNIKAIPDLHYPLTKEYLQPVFGDLSESVLEENKHDVLADVNHEVLDERWEEIRSIISEVPAYKHLLKILESINAKTTLSDLGIEETNLASIFEFSPYVRSRLTLLRVSKLLD